MKKAKPPSDFPRKLSSNQAQPCLARVTRTEKKEKKEKEKEKKENKKQRTRKSTFQLSRALHHLTTTMANISQHAALHQPDDHGHNARYDDEEDYPERPADFGAVSSFAVLAGEPGVAVEVSVSMQESDEFVLGKVVVKNALVFQLLLALLLVHVHGDGEAFPKRRVADAGHCG